MRIFWVVSVSILAADVAYADSTGDALAEIVQCTGIAEPSARLQCFDAAARRAKSAIAEHQEKEKRGTPDRFGLSQPRTSVTKSEDFGRPSPPTGPGEISQITAIVLKFAKSARGKSIFILDNGQVWRQLDGDDTDVLESQPGMPMKVTIASGLFGSYYLTVEGRKALVKVRRVK